MIRPSLQPPFQCCRSQGSYMLDATIATLKLRAGVRPGTFFRGARNPQIWLQRLGSSRLLHSVVNNSCGFNPQWKVVASIFSAARLPRLLKEICWQFAAGLPAFSLLPFFRTQTATCLQSWPFSDPRQGPEKGSLSFFSRQCPNWR